MYAELQELQDFLGVGVLKKKRWLPKTMNLDAVDFNLGFFAIRPWQLNK